MFDGLDINDIEIKKEVTPFKLNDLKLSHYHFTHGGFTKGMPILTTLEIERKYDENGEYLLKKVTHEYVSDENEKLTKVNEYTERIDNLELMIMLENYDLRSLQNNYYTEDSIESLSHYEIDYNYLFKIVGTYDNEINTFKDLSDILGFKEIIRDEINKTKDNGEQ